MSQMSLETLEAWCRARDFCLRIYKDVLPRLPAEEKWNLGQQLRRAALSIPANIAEGYGRFYYQDNVRFCYNARGSLQECVSHLLVAFEAGVISRDILSSIRQDADSLLKLINGYIGYLKRSKHGENEPGARYTVAEEVGLYDPERASQTETLSALPNDE